MTTDAREAVAEAIWNANPGCDEFGQTWPWAEARSDDLAADPTFAAAEAAITAHLAALAAAGKVILDLPEPDSTHTGCCHEIGLSAHAILCGGSDYPHDPDDLLRCLKVSPFPPLHMRTRSPEWAALVDNWQKLADMVETEQPTGHAPRTYRLMRELISNARKAKP